MLKIQLETAEANKTNQFHSNFRIKALQTFRKIIASNKRTLEDVVLVSTPKDVAHFPIW